MALRQTALVRDRLVGICPELAAAGALEIVTIREMPSCRRRRQLAHPWRKAQGLVRPRCDVKRSCCDTVGT